MLFVFLKLFNFTEISLLNRKYPEGYKQIEIKKPSAPVLRSQNRQPGSSSTELLHVTSKNQQSLPFYPEDNGCIVEQILNPSST